MTDEQKLLEAVYAINRAIEVGDDITQATLEQARDDIWLEGIRLYQWKD